MNKLKKIAILFTFLFMGVAIACATHVSDQTVRITFYPFLNPESYGDVCRTIWTVGVLQLAVIFHCLSFAVEE